MFIYFILFWAPACIMKINNLLVYVSYTFQLLIRQLSFHINSIAHKHTLICVWSIQKQSSVSLNKTNGTLLWYYLIGNKNTK